MFPRNWRIMLLSAAPAFTLGILLGTALASPRPVTLFLDGQKVNLAVPAQLINEEPMAPAQLDLLQQGIAPPTAMSPELQEKSHTTFVEAEWTTGVSSPWAVCTSRTIA